MVISLLVLAILGLLTGFVFSIPAAGPVMILITSNGLKGKLRFCHRVTYGAALADFAYAFVGVFAFAQLYEHYEPYIPYVLALGSVFLIGLGMKIVKTNIDFEQMDDSSILTDELRNIGGFRIGMIINFLNPALFIGWLASSFIMISLASSLGLNTGGLNAQLSNTIKNINNEDVSKSLEKRTHELQSAIHSSSDHVLQVQPKESSALQILLSSLVFALMLALGATIWFYYLSNFIVQHRHKLNLTTIQYIIKGLGLVLLVLGLYFAFHSTISFIK